MSAALAGHLIAESGASKTDWVWLEGGVERAFVSEGFSIHVMGWDAVEAQLRAQVLPRLEGRTPAAVSYYGASFSDGALCRRMEALLAACTGAPRVEVQEDLVAAGRATWGRAM